MVLVQLDIRRDRICDWIARLSISIFRLHQAEHLDVATHVLVQVDDLTPALELAILDLKSTESGFLTKTRLL